MEGETMEELLFHSEIHLVRKYNDKYETNYTNLQQCLDALSSEHWDIQRFAKEYQKLLVKVESLERLSKPKRKRRTKAEMERDRASQNQIAIV